MSSPESLENSGEWNASSKHVIQSRKGVFLWNTAFSIIGLVLALVSTIVLVPLYLHYIDKRVYGAWLASGNIISWLGMIDPGLSLVVQQKVAYAYGAGDRKALGEWVGASLLVNGVLALVLTLAGLGVAGFLPSLLKLPTDIPPRDLMAGFAWAVIGTGAFLFSFGASSINMGLQSTFGANGISTGAQLLRIVLICGLLIGGYGLVSIGLAGAISGLAAAVASSWYLHRRLRREGVHASVSAAGVRRLFGFLSYTSLLRVGHTLLQYMDLFFVARLLGPESVTVLRLSRASIDMCGSFAQRPAASIQSPLTHLLGGGEVDRAREVSLRFLRIELWLFAYMIGGLVLFNGPFVQLWVGSDLYGGNLLNCVLIGSFLFNAVATVLFNLCFAAGNIKNSSLMFMAQGCIYLVLLLVLTPRFLLIGAALASVLSFLLLPIWYYPRSFGRLYGVRASEWATLARTTTVAVGAACCAVLLLRYCFPVIDSWIGLGGWVMLYSVAFSGVLLIASRASRGEFCSLVSVLRRRLGIAVGSERSGE